MNVTVRVIDTPHGEIVQVIAANGVASFPSHLVAAVALELRKIARRKPSSRRCHKFPWSTAAKEHAKRLATLHEATNSPDSPLTPITYRTIAAELHARGYVDRLVDAATVRRLVVSLIGERRAAR